MRSDQDILALYVGRRTELVNYAIRIVGDRWRAEDVVQDAFLRVKGLPEGRILEDPIGYLYRIVRNLALDGQRRRSLENNLMVAEDGRDASDHKPSPETETVARDDLRRIAAALAELPERTRIALEMHRLGGCRLKDIASHLGISVTHAHELVVRGVHHCRRRLNTRS